MKIDWKKVNENKISILAFAIIGTTLIWFWTMIILQGMKLFF